MNYKSASMNALRVPAAALLTLFLACNAWPAGAGQYQERPPVPPPNQPVSGQSEDLQQLVRDAWLDGKLESALLLNAQLNPFDIDTSVRHGTAFLRGAVESEIDQQLAAEVALSIDGIDTVENQLMVDEQASVAGRESAAYREKAEWRRALENATLTAVVKSDLLLNPDTGGLDIGVDSADGVVTLSGRVDSREEAMLAAQVAAHVDGVREVRNLLQTRDRQ